MHRFCIRLLDLRRITGFLGLSEQLFGSRLTVHGLISSSLRLSHGRQVLLHLLALLHPHQRLTLRHHLYVALQLLLPQPNVLLVLELLALSFRAGRLPAPT